jgi:dTDP-4-dehydrorhamnose 3,5-epimerase
MKITKLKLDGLLLIELDIYRDNRGFFIERFSTEKFAQQSFTANFVQDNHSRSVPNVIRGLHTQFDPPQGKMVGVTSGAIWDVAVDIRKGSPTFGQYEAVELSDENGKMLWIPAGFAHGFCVLGTKPADVLYKVDGLYNPKTEIGIKWNDPDLAINWPVKEPIISDRDSNLMSLSEYAKLQVPN